MAIEFHPTTSADLAAIRALLQSAFGADTWDCSPAVLQWKYYDEGPPWEGSRSYVMRQGGEFLAHACVWPLQIATPTTVHPAMCFLDWASSKTNPGAGIALVKRLARLRPILVGIGGSDLTREILPRIGFTRCGELRVYARVLRPWKQFCTRPRNNLCKETARLVRNTAWSLSPTNSTAGWAAISEPVTDEAIQAGSKTGSEAHCSSLHDAAFMNYILKCPVSGMKFFALRKNGSLRGYFITSQRGGQIRLVDLRIQSATADDWRSAFAAAVHAAGQEHMACELVAWGTFSEADEALTANHFHLRETVPVFVYDPERRLPPAPFSMLLSMADNDSFYLSSPEYPYIT